MSVLLPRVGIWGGGGGLPWQGAPEGEAGARARADAPLSTCSVALDKSFHLCEMSRAVMGPSSPWSPLPTSGDPELLQRPAPVCWKLYHMLLSLY